MGNDFYEERTFKSFIILMITIFLIPFILGVVAGPILGEKVIAKLVFIYTAAVFILISYIIYKKERVYWLTSYSYKDACNMTSEERKAIGYKLFKISLTYCSILIGYLVISIFADISWLIDMVVFSVVIIMICVKS